MKNNKSAHPVQNEYPIPQLREELRLRACGLADRLARSVGRLTSCDWLPCTEYGEEIARERTIAEELFYVQQCRRMLEYCLAKGSGSQTYRWSCGAETVTVFRRTGPNRARVSGLLETSPAGNGAA